MTTISNQPNWTSLTPDVWELIFDKIPEKYVGRSKSCCKLFNQIITSSYRLTNNLENLKEKKVIQEPFFVKNNQLREAFLNERIMFDEVNSFCKKANVNINFSPTSEISWYRWPVFIINGNASFNDLLKNTYQIRAKVWRVCDTSRRILEFIIYIENFPIFKVDDREYRASENDPKVKVYRTWDHLVDDEEREKAIALFKEAAQNK